MSDHADEVEPAAKRRRLLAQTMGQQLREVELSRTARRESTASSTGGASGIYLIRSVYGALATDRVSSRPVQAPIETSESDVVPGEDDHLPTGTSKSASRYLWQPSEVRDIPGSDGCDSFTFDDLLDWSRSYFDNWHPAYPFLHALSILEYFDHMAQNGPPNSDSAMAFQLTLVRSIMSISLADRRQTGTNMRPIPANLVFNSFDDAIGSIQRVLFEESSMLTLQAVVSVQLFLVSMLRYNAASRLEGLAVRMAFQLGLHRCPMRSSAFSAKEAEVRQRLFWSMYCIDRYICVRLGLPAAIGDEIIDTCHASSEKHRRGDDIPPNRDARLDLLEFLARHAEIRGSIMHLRSKSGIHTPMETDQAVVINTELTKWENDINEYLDSNDSMSLPISTFHQTTLVILRYESIIALNRSILAISKRSSAYNAALQSCIGASRSIINTLYKALKPLAAAGQPEGAGNAPLLWPSFTWAVWMSAFIMVYAANDDQVPREVAIRFTERSLEVLEHLALRGSVWPNACAVAIRDLREQLMHQNHKAKDISVQHGYGAKGPQSEELWRIPSKPVSQQGRASEGELRSSPSNVTIEQPQYADATSSRVVHSTPQDEQGSVSKRRDHLDASVSTRLYFESGATSRSDNPAAANSNTGNTGENLMFADSFGFADPSGDTTGMGQLHLPGFRMPNVDGMDLFYGSDIPFWMGDDQWPALGEK